MARSTYTIDNAVEFKSVFDTLALDPFIIEKTLDPRALGYTVGSLRVKLCDALKYLADKCETVDMRYMKLKHDFTICVIGNKAVIKRTSLTLGAKERQNSGILLEVVKVYENRNFTHPLRKLYIECLRVFNTEPYKKAQLPYIITQREFNSLKRRLTQLKPDALDLNYDKKSRLLQIFVTKKVETERELRAKFVEDLEQSLELGEFAEVEEVIEFDEDEDDENTITIIEQ